MTLLSFLPDGVRIWEERGDGPARLFPEEEAAIRGAVPRRRAEFTTGRHCARAALRALGAPAGAIPVGAHREPVWPPGVVGSLTHCDGYRAAAVGWSGQPLLALGIDAEPNAVLPAGVGSLVLLPGDGAPGSLDAAGVCVDRLVFSAKESLFKAWWTLEHRWLDFTEATVGVREDGQLDITLLVERTVPGRYHGRWATADGLLHTVVMVAPASPEGLPGPTG